MCYAMPYELFISLRYLRAKRKQAFISLISVISVGGVAVGVAALIIVLAIMTGFQNDIRDKILATMAHILIQNPGMTRADADALTQELRQLPEIRSFAPYITGQVLLSSEDNVAGVEVMGIDPASPEGVAHLAPYLKEGRIELLSQQFFNENDPAGPKRDGVIVGMELARMLGVFVGDDVTMILPMGRILPTGPVPKLKKLRVVGLISTEYYEYDAGLAYISLTAAQRFFSMGDEITGLEIRLNDVYQTASVTNAVKQRIDARYNVKNWTEMNKSLFSAINLEKFAMSLILALIVVVAAFNIISMLVMMVIEKQGDIATLKCLGATSQSIMKVFMLEGSVIGVVGTIIGTITGVLVCWVADAKKLIPLDGGMYYLDHLPFVISPLDVATIAAAALLICFLSTLYPAQQASKLDPVVVFRYE